uniref:Uncharacterized protein n=1 Tax=Oryza glaberrima TaxID=4538 RepID=I1NUV8_ORYGL
MSMQPRYSFSQPPHGPPRRDNVAAHRDAASASHACISPTHLLTHWGQCGSLLHPRRLRFSVAPVAAAKPEAVGTTGEAAAAPVEELAKSLQGVELFDLRGKAVPVVDLWKDRNFLSCFGRLIVFETIDDGCLHVCALPFHLQKHKMFSFSTFAAPPPSQQLRAAASDREEEKNDQGGREE